MLNESLLWRRTISPTGRVQKHPKPLRIIIETIGFAAALIILYIAFH
jgi:hypothetical protein